MEDVSYDNSVGNSRKAFITAREQAIKLFGREGVKLSIGGCGKHFRYWPSGRTAKTGPLRQKEG